MGTVLERPKCAYLEWDVLFECGVLLKILHHPGAGGGAGDSSRDLPPQDLRIYTAYRVDPIDSRPLFKRNASTPHIPIPIQIYIHTHTHAPTPL